MGRWMSRWRMECFARSVAMTDWGRRSLKPVAATTLSNKKSRGDDSWITTVKVLGSSIDRLVPSMGLLLGYRNHGTLAHGNGDRRRECGGFQDRLGDWRDRSRSVWRRVAVSAVLRYDQATRENRNSRERASGVEMSTTSVRISQQHALQRGTLSGGLDTSQGGSGTNGTNVSRSHFVQHNDDHSAQTGTTINQAGAVSASRSWNSKKRSQSSSARFTTGTPAHTRSASTGQHLGPLTRKSRSTGVRR